MADREPFLTNIHAGPKKGLRGERGVSVRLVDGELGPSHNVDMHINTLLPGSGPGPFHFHEIAENVYLVLEGEIQVDFGNESRRLAEGDVIMIPPGVAHGTSNPSDSPARFIEIYAPSGPDFHIVDEIGDTH